MKLTCHDIEEFRAHFDRAVLQDMTLREFVELCWLDYFTYGG